MSQFTPERSMLCAAAAAIVALGGAAGLADAPPAPRAAATVARDCPLAAAPLAPARRLAPPRARPVRT